MTDADPYAAALAEETELDRIRTRMRTEAELLGNANRQREQAASRCAAIARTAADAGIPETHIAREMNVNRRTVRRWLGKPE